MVVMKNEVCSAIFSRSYIDGTKLCASGGLRFIGSAPCKGDSGGPLVLFKTNQLMGVVSFGRGSCVKGSPVAYTRINSHKDFILRIIGKI